MGDYTYSFCDVVVATRLLFPELPTAPTGARPQVSFELIDQPSLAAEADWQRCWEFPDRSATVFSMEPGGLYRYRLDSMHGPRFYISSDGRRIDCDRWQGDEDTVRHLFADQVLPRVLSHLGSLILHAACVETVHGAIAIFGESGRGKSTLSYALRELGCRVLSDDCVKLVPHNGRYRAIATYPSLRLWPDVVTGLSIDSVGSIPVAGYSNKQRIDVTSQQAALAANIPVELTLGILLGETNRTPRADENFASDPAVVLRTLGKQTILVQLLKQTFHLDARHRDGQQRSFGQLEQLVRTLPFYGLTYVRDLGQLPDVARTLIRQLAETMG